MSYVKTKCRKGSGLLGAEWAKEGMPIELQTLADFSCS